MRGGARLGTGRNVQHVRRLIDAAGENQVGLRIGEGIYDSANVQLSY